MIKNVNLQVFSHPKFGEVHITVDENGIVLFKANDVAIALGYKDYRRAVADHCKGVGVLPTPSARGSQPTKYINEADVYRLVMRSKLPDAIKFQDWVCEDILPSIRKHGAYLTDEALQRAITDPDFLIALANNLKKERNGRITAENKCVEQQAKIEEQKKDIECLNQRVSYIDYVLQSDGLINISVIAQDYGIAAVSMNKILQELRIQYRRSSRDPWMLYAPYKDKGYVQSETYVDDTNTSRMHTKWTQKGRLFLYEKLKAIGMLPTIEKNQITND